MKGDRVDRQIDAAQVKLELLEAVVARVIFAVGQNQQNLFCAAPLADLRLSGEYRVVERIQRRRFEL